MVIVIEDEPQLLELLAVELELIRQESACFTDLQDANSSLQRPDVNLVIADVGAVSGGQELLRELQSRKPMIPVIFVSGNQNVSLRTLFARGAAGFYSKPFARKDFLVQVENLLLPLDQRWPKLKFELEAPEGLAISSIHSIAWGRYGFTINHGELENLPKYENQLMTLPGSELIKVIAHPVWDAGQESGWLIDHVLNGREAVIHHTKTAPETVGIPFTCLI